MSSKEINKSCIISNVAIIGSGVIGCNWAVLFARAGINVNLFDIHQLQTDRAIKIINEKLVEYPKDSLGHVNAFNCIEQCMINVQYVQECIPETVELKKQIFFQLDEILSKQFGNCVLISSHSTITSNENNKLDLPTENIGKIIILASSSSGIPCSKFANNLIYKTRCIIAHPLNPPLLCPLVELVPAPFTDPHVTTLTFDLMLQIGQKPIVLKKEVLGFAVNRIQYALLAECWRLVKDGVLSAKDVDYVMTDGLGLRYAFFGPFLNCHLNADGIEDYMKRYGDSIEQVISDFGPSPVFSGKTLQSIILEMEGEVPMDKIGEVREKREICLQGISSLKDNLKL